MKKPAVLNVVLLLAMASGCAYLPFSRGELNGAVSAPLDDWRAIGEVAIVQLETNPVRPYSVNVWMIAARDHVYVYAGRHSQWAKNIEADPAVRLKAGDQIFELRASRVTDPDEFLRFAEAWQEKYSNDRSDSSVAETYLFRLIPAPGDS